MIRALALVLLCAAFLQGGLNKLIDFSAAVGETTHFGLPFPAFTAAATLGLEIIGSLCIISGFLRKPAAIALAIFTLAATLLANRYWELPIGQERFMTANGFFEHLGLIGGFLFVAFSERDA